MTPTELRTYRTTSCPGLTQAQVAADLQVAPNTVARWERGTLAIPWWVGEVLTLREKVQKAAWDSLIAGSRGRQTARFATKYKALARKYHPDRNPEGAEVMRDINELAQTLQPRRRRRT